MASQAVPQVNPAAINEIGTKLTEALSVVAKELQGNVEEKISVVAQRDFTGQTVSRAEQGIGPGEPPRVVSGDLYGNVDSFAEPIDGGARGVVTSSRDDDPSVPYLLEFSLGIKYMQPARDEFVNIAAEKLAYELRKILK